MGIQGKLLIVQGSIELNFYVFLDEMGQLRHQIFERFNFFFKTKKK